MQRKEKEAAAAGQKNPDNSTSMAKRNNRSSSQQRSAVISPLKNENAVPQKTDSTEQSSGQAIAAQKYRQDNNSVAVSKSIGGI
jgi:hypothetical protein